MIGRETPLWILIFQDGMVAESAYLSIDHIQPVGSVFAFPALNRTLGNAQVRIRYPDPGKLGIVRMTISLFMGDTGAIDIDRLNVSRVVYGFYEQIGQTFPLSPVSPNSTITGKYTMLPGRSADSDNRLKPGEQFEILGCFSTGVQPWGTFTLTLSPDGSAMPLAITRTAPPGMHPVMNLG